MTKLNVKKMVVQPDWYAWINTMPIQPTKGGTLHVIGEVTTHPMMKAVLFKRVPQGINGTVLQLGIGVMTADAPSKQPQQVHYFERLAETNQYTSIEIFDETGEKIATIDKIDIIE